MPEVNKAELIEGVVYMPSPVCHADHGAPHFDLITIAGVYRAWTPGVDGGDNSTIRLDLGNVPQPDVFLRLLAEYGGQSRITHDGYVESAPEWVGEVSASSASYDLHAKLAAYQRNNVREYVVVRAPDKELDWFLLRGGHYDRMSPTAEGGYQSKAFPGLWIDAAALFRRDMVRALEVVQLGITSQEHAEFVSKLELRRSI